MLVLALLAFNGRVVDGEVYVPNLPALSSEHGAYMKDRVDMSSYVLTMTSVHPLLVPV